MSEELTITSIDRPNTVLSLKSDLEKLGIEPGMTLLVHSSLSKIGWVCGGAVAVIQAIMQVITMEGTLVMPSHSGDLSEPGRWAHPPVPESWWQPIRETMPAFDPQITPTRGMGTIAEIFRTFPDVIRSNHPCLSFSAWGKLAEKITANHSLAYSLGDESPLARVYEAGGSVLLLGVGFGNNTSFHLCEYRAENKKLYTEGSPITENGKRVWKRYEEVDWDDELFVELGADFEKTGFVRTGKIGSADVKLFPQKPAVDFGVAWLNRKNSRD